MPTSQNFGESIYVIVYRLILGPIAIIGNGLILYIAIKYKKFCGTFCNCLITLLAFGEFVSGIGLTIRAIFSIYIESQNFTEYDRFECILAAIPHMFGISFGQVILLAIAIDRFLAVNQPMAYIRSTYKSEFVATITSALTLSIFFCWFSIYDLEPTPVKQCSAGASGTTLFASIWSVVGVAIAVSILGFYISTVFTIKKRRNFNDRTVGLLVRRQKRVFITISLILLSYAVFWCIPLFVMIVVVYAKFDSIQGYTSTLIGLCSGLHSVLVFFIYLLKHRDLRKYFKQLFPRFEFFKPLTKKVVVAQRNNSSKSKGTVETNGNNEDEILL